MANKTTSEKNKPTRKTLRPNEYYNPKTKRYEYHYKDCFGKARVISSYRLEMTDQLPKGKRSSKSLREKEAEINACLENNIDVDGAKLTLLEVVDRYLNFLYNRKKLAHNTKVGYNVTVNTLKQYKLGYMEIGKIRPEHCEEWLADMKKKYRGSSIQTQISLIKRTFEYALDYDYVAKNPFRRITTDRSDSKKMKALSVEDMNRFLDFCLNDTHSSHCYDMLYVLFWSGLRASELCGLTLDNIDMDNRMIVVDKQLQCVNHTHVVLPTKTMNGERIIPMTDGVYESFQRIIKNRYLKGDIEPVCFDEQGNAYEGFVFLATRSRKTIVRGHVEEYLQNCIKRFNNANPDNPIRKFEPHICRHTFATNMQYLPPKTLQYILGHGNIATTMDNYVDVKPGAEQLAQINAVAKQLTAN
ncbi:tyrosine-type recombinase/integrase [Coprococcus eutactus]|uniref:tyrosine-type recombinase/integrase n=1 Tax=Coprococcus eutactus TaxID=33043 RepID=UPI001D08DE1F|nr:tyrosine-type recombinase/integrase [Coprococcus eutactus]MCB6628416.1 tyrosine-type recombinase/integrase [Coprococcus eutactus]MCG4789273.1 tyrosine-type recombinase/integrase [Coprococcus eutactus]MCQ5118263.1 tyrosine-type recombinase/integrase [Coprococcus eutactus]MCQ5131889.1 tyrosine-type recombinase/integrase [Coprococcus eutactus]MCQ5135625.1 tyrosine-type recombinase/integrase [Coprococcus eutactus]